MSVVLNILKCYNSLYYNFLSNICQEVSRIETNSFCFKKNQGSYMDKYEFRLENRNSDNKKTLGFQGQGFLSMPATGIEPVREVSPAGF